MSARIIILGAGIVGRMAKIMFPEAQILESKNELDVFTSELGVCISITPIPELRCHRYTRYITIDGESPTVDLINKYKKKISREGEISYGDYRQFEPEQVVYGLDLPRGLDIQFTTSVVRIELDSKIVFTVRDSLKYDILISTIPLINLVKISDLFDKFIGPASSFFMHRPIYLTRTEDLTDDHSIRENYITDADTPIYRENRFNGFRNQESLFKIEDAFKIYPGKIYPNSHTQSILKDLESFKIFCAGRYAQWDNTIHLWNAYRRLIQLRGEI